MFDALTRLLRKRPKGYDRAVNIRFAERRFYEGYLKTGDQLFTRECIRLNRVDFDVLIFEIDGIVYQFVVKVGDLGIRIEKGRVYRGYVNADRNHCWFVGREHPVHVRKNDDEGEDGEDT